jgi:predicted nucleotidyltransferase
MDSKGRIEKLLEKAKQNAGVLAVILFGSTARAERGPASDLDVCLVLENRKYAALDLSRIKMAYLGHAGVDVQVFQQLPIYIRTRVLKEGTVLLVRDEDALYELAFRTAQAFEDFKPVYRTYLAEVARAGS